jgi:signal transduction histidine kinase
VAYVGAVGALVRRYRGGDDRVRQQILWPLWGGLVTLVLFVGSALFNTDAYLSIYPVLLIPVCVSVAVLRYRLLDIRLVVSRSLLYVLLSALAIAAYLGIVAGTEHLLRGIGPSVLAALFLAAAFNPVRVIMQQRIDRFFFGARRDPARAIAAVGARLEEPAPAGLSGVLEGLCQVMRLPWASLTVNGREIAAHGQPPELRHAVSLRQGGDTIGELTVGVRPGEHRLDAADEQVLRLLSTSLAVAVQATLLAVELGRARGALVTTREEERSRIRRDLHDGLGPTLTAVVLKADVARRVAGSDPAAAAAMMTDLRRQVTEAIDNIRRLVHELRPPALDGLGLVGALREQATILTHRIDGAPLTVTIETVEPFAQLPPAVEVAAYRIATEALTNVTRHAIATTANVHLQTIDGQLRLVIDDNGVATGSWRPGFGLRSIRDRAFELGGSCQAGPYPAGGRVHVTIPLVTP